MSAKRPFDKHVRREALTSAAINGVLSAVATFAKYGGVGTLPFRGWGGLIADGAPQGFMIALMGTIVPALLARGSIQRGVIERAALPSPIRILCVAIGFAALSSTAAVLTTTAVATMSPAAIPFSAALPAKILLGAALGWIATRTSLLRLFPEQPPRGSN